MLVPQKPTDRLEGYIEGTAGDYDLKRIQGVLNVLVSDAFRVRVGIDHNERDGYLKNVGKIGFGPYGDAGGSVDYTAYRISAIADLMPTLTNYFIANYSESESTGVTPKITKAFYREPYSLTTGIAAAGTLDAGQQVSGLVTANGLIALNQMAS